MNKAVIIIAVIVSALILSVACDDKKTSDKPTEYNIDGHTLIEVTVDGCQYLSSYQTNGLIFVHKGNCTNHRSK